LALLHYGTKKTASFKTKTGKVGGWSRKGRMQYILVLEHFDFASLAFYLI